MLKLDRATLAKIAPNPEAIKSLELLFKSTNQNSEDAANAITVAEGAQQAATQANTKANTAITAAGDAQQAANSAISVANDANTLATNAKSAADNASQQSANALSAANSAQTDVTNFKSPTGSASVGFSPSGNLSSGNVQDAIIESVVVARSGLLNVLLNASFFVNQRGYPSGLTTTAANQYTLDQWRVVVSGQSIVYAASGGSRIATAPVGGMEQTIEGNLLTQAEYTINWEGTASCAIDGTQRAKKSVVTVTPGTNSVIRFSGGTVANPQFEPGKVAHPPEQRPYSLDLWLCQRHAYGWTSTGALGGCNAGGGDIGLNFPNTMRANPTFFQGTLPTFVDGTALFSTTSLVLVYADKKGARVQFASTGTTPGRVAIFNNDGSGLFSCEL